MQLTSELYTQPNTDLQRLIFFHIKGKNFRNDKRIEQKVTKNYNCNKQYEVEHSRLHIGRTSQLQYWIIEILTLLLLDDTK